MNNIHCIPVGNGEPLHECHTLCWCHPVKDPESVNLYAHNAKDCREKWERQGLDMPPLSLWVTVEEKLNKELTEPARAGRSSGSSAPTTKTYMATKSETWIPEFVKMLLKRIKAGEFKRR